MTIDPSKYLVLDVETNGLKASRDDLLSISIYKPDDGKIFDRFLPLEKQRRINPEAAKVNGITLKDLEGREPLNQDEFDAIAEEFEMKKRTILVFGGKEFDRRFLEQYMKDHHLVGIEEMSFCDFQEQIISVNCGKQNQASKDNLCIAFGIDGVSSKHSSRNDCYLEWQLFCKIDGRTIFVTENQVFALTPDYVIPVSYLDKSTKLRTYAGIQKRYCETEKVFELVLSAEASRHVIKFQNNITGLTIENLICGLLNSRQIDSRQYLLENKRKLEYIGEFPNGYKFVRYTPQQSGSIALLPEEYRAASRRIENMSGVEDLKLALSLLSEGRDIRKVVLSHQRAIAKLLEIAERSDDNDERDCLNQLHNKICLACQINQVNEVLASEIQPLIHVLQDKLGEVILSQEMVINHEANCLALCDLSSESAVVEIKTADSRKKRGDFANEFANQLFYSSNGRDCYLLRIEWGNVADQGLNDKCTRFILEKVSFSDTRSKSLGRSRKSDKRKPRIRHAVADWRFANPQEQDPRRCSLSLWLSLKDVERVWEKCDPSAILMHVPKGGKSSSSFAVLKNWITRNPHETRLLCSRQTGLSLQTVEKWWFAAKSVVCGNNKTSEILSNEALRASINDLAKQTTIAPVASREMIAELKQEIAEYSYQSGVSRHDPDHDVWSPYYVTVSRFRLLPNWERYLDEFDVPEERVDAAVKAIDFICYCRREIADGVSVLRIPLSKTRFTTSESFRKFDPARAKVVSKGSSDSRKKDPIEVLVTDKKAALISPRSRELYKSAVNLVEVPIERVFVESGIKRTEHELVLAGFPNT